MRRSQNHFRIDTSFESVTRVARQTQFTRSLSNARRQKVSRFEQNAFCRSGDASFLAAHHAADSNRAFLIGDDAHFLFQGVVLPVEREKLFAIALEPDIDRAF